MSARRSPRRSETTGTKETTAATGTTDAARTAVVPMSGTGAGPKPDPTAFTRTAGEPDSGCRRATTRTTDDDAAE